MKKIMISAMSSGSGKTVLTCGLLAAYKKRGVFVESFKCGPDYIDPMFHERVMGIKCRNLDLFLQGEDKVKKTLAKQKAELAIIEGAMGYYDGLDGTESKSAFETAKVAKCPVILAVRPKGNSVSLAAQILGMVNFRKESNIVGVILTDCSERLYAYISEIIKRETKLRVFGYVPPMEEAKLESRHLGLITAEEVDDFEHRFEHIASQLEKSVDLDGILSTAAEVEHTELSTENPFEHGGAHPTIAVAKDEAFCFYYVDSLDCLEENGAELVFFSPIHDKALPPCDGIYLGGGYPELYAGELSKNEDMKTQIRNAINSGVPTLAECGGFLYLQSSLESSEGAEKPMAGVFSGKGFKTSRLQRFGYAKLLPENDSMLFRAGENVPVHEFHYWDCSENGSDLALKKADGREWRCGFTGKTLYAAFPHLHLDGKIPAGRRFVEAAEEFRKSRRGGF